ncbi:BRCA1 carboxy-terminus (BRCT) domain protein [Ceratobasidium sp. AG-Ba]|nr:BRCA1 carboxy-terminus (BRCT) domain protein [Ceratobasidium sp. AG-Ba]
MRFDGSDDDSDDQQLPTSSQGGGGKGKAAASQSRPSSQAKDMSRLFVDGDGGGIAFYIQDQGLNEDQVEDLKNKIKGHGGLAVGSHRTAAYILVDPSTEEGAESISKHTTPSRRVVSTKFIDESIRRAKLVPNLELGLFIKEDRPVLFYLHESLEDAAEGLRDKILLRGGNPDAVPGDAQVAIHSTTWDDGKDLQRRFKQIVRVETVDWLESCITRNRFSLEKPPSISVVHKTSSKPGRKPGAPRNEFTKKDDQFLVAWMATQFGASTAGRAGNRAYQEMVEIPEYKKWSQGHTWHSWRERYKNKKKQLDPLILAYIAQHGTTQPNEGTDEESDELPELEPKHGPYKKPRRNSKKRKSKEDKDTEEDGESDGSHHSNESYRPEKEKEKRKKRQRDANQHEKESQRARAKEKEKEIASRDEGEEGQVDTSVDTSTQARAKKRARIDTAAPETRVIKASSSQTPGLASQKPFPSESSSQKPLPPSQKPLSASESSSVKKPPLSQTLLASSQKVDSSQKPTGLYKAARRPTRPVSPPSPSRSSSVDNPTSPQAWSPTPPLANIPEVSRPKPTQSMTTTTTLLESQGTQDTTMSTSTEDEAPRFEVDPALKTSEAQALLNRKPTVVDRFEDMGLSSSQPQQEDMEADDDDDDDNVEVGGVSQYQRIRTQGDEFSEDVEERLLELAERYDVSVSEVRAHFGLAKNEELNEAVELTRLSVKQMIRDRRQGARQG